MDLQLQMPFIYPFMRGFIFNDITVHFGWEPLSIYDDNLHIGKQYWNIRTAAKSL